MTRKYPLPCLLLLLLCAGANAENEARCIRRNLVEVNGLLPGMDEVVLESRNGYLGQEPIRGEDDGGNYTGYKYSFSSYQVVTARGTIDSIYIASTDVLWAHGIRVGSDRDSIDRAPGFAEAFRGDSDSQYLVCSDIGDTYAVLRYENNVLAILR